jgi:hypothetical protein
MILPNGFFKVAICFGVRALREAGVKAVPLHKRRSATQAK